MEKRDKNFTEPLFDRVAVWRNERRVKRHNL